MHGGIVIAYFETSIGGFAFHLQVMLGTRCPIIGIGQLSYGIGIFFCQRRTFP